MAGNLLGRLTGHGKGSDKEFEVKREDAEWRKQLSPAAYHVMREHGTERAGTSPLDKKYDPGVYYCAGCGQPLFEAATKFNSGSGWPSFHTPMDEAVETDTDTTFFMEPAPRFTARSAAGISATSSRTRPKPTGLRYCMNGVSLDFKPDEKKS